MERPIREVAPEMFEFSREIRLELGNRVPKKYTLEKYRPKKEWFYYEYTCKHGSGHVGRVLILAELEAQLAAKRLTIPLNNDAIRYAAVTHDLQRQSDEADEAHGRRAAIWVKEHLQGEMDEQTLEMVAEINARHNDHEKFHPDSFPELAILKDADALDRARFKRGFSVFNRKTLRLPEAHTLITPAEVIFSLSENKSQTGEDPFTAALDAASELGFITWGDQKA